MHCNSHPNNFQNTLRTSYFSVQTFVSSVVGVEVVVDVSECMWTFNTLPTIRIQCWSGI